MNVDTHVHSRYSFDSLNDPGRILTVAKLRGLSAISITDHDSMAVYERYFDADPDVPAFQVGDLAVIKGTELSTADGDLIGLFLREPISTDDFRDAARRIAAQDGLAVLPHPFHRPTDPAELIDAVDLVEVRNGRCRPSSNSRAARLARSHDKPAIAGSDAHAYWEIGHLHTAYERDGDGPISSSAELQDLLLDGSRTARGWPLPYYLTRGVSHLSKKLKEVLDA